MRVLARLMALAAALLLVLPAGALPAVYYCHWMGETMTSCCCRGKVGAERAKGDTDDQVRRRACCEIVPGSEASASGTLDAPLKIDAAGIVARLPIEYVVPVRSRVVPSTPAQARAPPSLGPPLFISHCSLLI